MRMAVMILTTANIKVRTMMTDSKLLQHGQKCLLSSSPYSLASIVMQSNGVVRNYF